MINGEWTFSSNNEFNTYNPFNRKLIKAIPDASENDIYNAIDSAKNAFKTWSKTSPYERSSYLMRAWNLMIEATDDLANTMTLEQGKPLKASKAEVKYASDFLLRYAEEAKRINGEWLSSEKSNQKFLTLKMPVGVVGAITPWNYPISMITRKIAPALAAGCTVILKPSEYTPLCAIEVFKILIKSGIPKGVINLITTSDPSKVGNIFTSDPRISKITFTGSTEVGRELASKSGKNLKRISLELGGHAPFIVFPDSDPIHAAKGVAALKFLNSGQACISPNRIYIHKKMKEVFEKTLCDRVDKIKVGNGLEEGIGMGPLINSKAINKLKNQIQDASSKGANVIRGGDIIADINLKNGYFFPPTILTNVKKDMLIYKQETFGPIAPIIIYEDIEEVINMANDTDYGLAAYIYTNNISLAIKAMEMLNFAIIGINDVNPTSASIPFGGIGNSGIGREGGTMGIEEYLENKSVGITI